jgi:hypothetical protein
MILQTPAPTPEFVPTIGFIIAACIGALPILGVVVWGAVKIFSPLTQALGRRLGGGGDEDRLEQRLEALGQELDQVRAHLAETNERLEFAERLLAQGRHPEQLPRG